MRFAFTSLVLGSFLGITLFGVLAVNHADSHGFVGCLASLVKGGTCPEQTNLFSFASFHLDVFKIFSLAFLILLLLAGNRAFLNAVRFVLNQVKHAVFEAETFLSLAWHSFFRWLSLRLNSPNIA